MANNCEAYSRFLCRIGKPVTEWQSLNDIPPLPVAMFKRFELRAVTPESIVRELHSSSTTGQMPSRIFIDKSTAFRQARALTSVLKEHIGGTRRPYLVLDAEKAIGKGEEMTARGAAIRGLGNFASVTEFAMDQLDNGLLVPDFDRVAEFLNKHQDRSILLFGFTYIVWTRFVLEAEKLGLSFNAPGARLLHSGGWKRLKEQRVSKETFSERTAAILGCPPNSIVDFYGTVEQVGTIFLDCEAGNKHAPAYADVILRAPHTLVPVGRGEEGIIEILSILPTSYPAQAIMTDDKGQLIGVDDCPCGRKGLYFRFTSRIEQSEIRGCGDTFAHGERE